MTVEPIGLLCAIPALSVYFPSVYITGDYTQTRNGAIQKMLRMVGFGDNIGSGLTKIKNAWKGLGFPSPTIRQEDEVDEVWLTLPLPAGFPIFIASYDGANGTHDGVNGTNSSVKMEGRGEEIDSKGEEIPKRGEETDSKGEETLGIIPENNLESLNDLQKQLLTLMIQKPTIIGLTAISGLRP